MGYKLPTLGPRYVFFSSLPSAARNVAPYFPGLASFYSNAFATGQNLVKSAAAALQKIDPTAEENESISRMQMYVNFFGDAAKNEQANEIAFLNKANSYLNKMNDSPKLQQQIQRYLNQIQKGGSIDYQGLINLLNNIISRFNKDTDKIDKIYEDNIRIISQLISQLDKQNYEELESLFNSGSNNDIREYNRKINALLRSYSPTDSLDSADFKTSYSNLLASRINSVLVNLQNNGFLNVLVRQDFLSNSNGKIVGARLVTYIYDYLSQLDFDKLKNASAADLAEAISTDRQFNAKIEAIAQEHVDEVMSHFTKKQDKEQKTIEEIALTSGRNTSIMLKNLSNPQAFIEDYQKELGDMREVLEKFAVENKKIAATERKSREKASKIINKAIRERYATKLAESTKTSIQEKVRDLKINFKYKVSQQNINRNLNVKTQGYNIAELLASDELRQALPIVLANPGTSVQLKNDISYIINFDGQLDLIKNKTTQKNIQVQIDNLPQTFIQTYNEASRGATSVKTAIKSYIQVHQDLLNQLKQLKNQHKINSKEYERILNYLDDTIIGGISIKDYTYGSNQFGFHGGSLGATPEKILDNIQDMYELGGITPIDRDLLLFAIMNCSPEALGASLKQPLATYLLGGAALMMFDDGFTASTKFLERMKADLGTSGGGKLHLFSVQGRYIPASYVYMHIYNNLLAVVNDINSNYQQISDAKYGGKVEINNNITHQTDLYLTQRSVADRWGTTRNNALSSININFTFLAGILDIFEGLPAAFNI